MSKFVPTRVGVFRHWKDDHGGQGFLLHCAECNDWLPAPEEVLSGQQPLCIHQGTQEFGKWLVATLQARHLIAEEGLRPYLDDEAAAFKEAAQMQDRP